MKKSYWMAAGAGVAVLLGAAWWWNQNAARDTVQYRTAKLERGPLMATVSASGTVNPVTQVSVGTQVSGQIKDLLVDFNSEVRAGQLIAQIDPETFEYRVRAAQADLDSARAAVVTAQASAAASLAAVSRAQVDLTEAERDLERKRNLVERQFIAQSESDKARALVNTSTEALKSAQAQAAVTQSQIRSAQANVAQRESALAQSRIDLARTRITSPVNGIVIKRTIEKGQTVAASLQSPELFVIAQNLSDMQVDASIDESDVGRIRTGQKATFTVDAFSGQTFEGEVRQVRKAAQSVANVVTYVAVVGFSNPGNRLLPGMTANVRVVTDARDQVLKVPNAALRVRLAGMEPSAGASASARAGAPSLGSSASMGNNPAAEFRARVQTELALSAAQIEKVDAIYADMRPKFAALRELPEAERSRARERISADVRARIADLLTPEQKPKYAALQAQGASRGGTSARLYLLGSDGKPVPYNVRLGISDGSSTELLVAPGAPEAMALKEGAAVITGTNAPGAAGAPTGNSGPRLPF